MREGEYLGIVQVHMAPDHGWLAFGAFAPERADAWALYTLLCSELDDRPYSNHDILQNQVCESRQTSVDVELLESLDDSRDGSRPGHFLFLEHAEQKVEWVE